MISTWDDYSEGSEIETESKTASPHHAQLNGNVRVVFLVVFFGFELDKLFGSAWEFRGATSLIAYM